MDVVADPETRAHIAERGGAVYVWPELVSCCRVRTFVLEADTKAPARSFELVHAARGFHVFATPGLVPPRQLDLELDRGELRAYWNGQGWIG